MALPLSDHNIAFDRGYSNFLAKEMRRPNLPSKVGLFSSGGSLRGNLMND